VALEEAASKGVSGQGARRIRLGPGGHNEGFVGNSIRTAKYNVLTFLPIFLLSMFSRVAYFYFLVQVSSQPPTFVHRTTLFPRNHHISLNVLLSWPSPEKD
jgi:hypothetical protein